MTIYRGEGGTGSATSDADTTLYQDFLDQTKAARDAAAVSATNASTSASTAATQASNASSSASAASGSASAAAASASTATTKASEASSSASSASVSASAADASAAAAAASAASINPALFMHLAGTETVTGSKTFSSLITGDISGNAGTVTNGVYLNSTQTLTNKTLTSPVINSPTGITKADVGLSNVDNTSDATKNSATATLTNKTLTSPSISSPTISDGTANGVAYLNGSKALTSGSGWTYDGTTVTLSSSTAYYPQSVQRNTTADANASYLVLDKNRNGAVVQNGDVLGNLVFRGYDGASYLQGAYINAVVSAAPGTNDMPTDLVFGTTPDNNAGPSERMRITQAGNVGIGTSSPGAKLQVGDGTSAVQSWTSGSNSGTGGGAFTAVRNGSSYVAALGNASALLGGAYSASPVLYFNGGLQFSEAGTERMRIDSSGNLGVGGSPNNYAGYKTLAVIGPDTTHSGIVRVRTSDDGIGVNIYADATGPMFNTTNHPLRFLISDTERARIDSSGNLLLGTTSNPAGSKLMVGGGAGGIYVQQATASGYNYNSNAISNAGTYYHFIFYSNGTQTGGIIASTTTTTYATSSDYRLKNTIAPMTGALAKVAALKPVTYKWNADGSDGEGFIAHELAEVVPDAVTGEKDAVDSEGKPVYQGIDTSFLVATLTAAIQEQQAMIESLTSRIAALDARLVSLEAK